MSEPEGYEISLDELKDVSGGLKGDDRGTYGIGGGSSKGRRTGFPELSNISRNFTGNKGK